MEISSFVHEVLDAIGICKSILDEEREYADVAFSIGIMYRSIGMTKEMKEYMLKAYYIYPLDEKLYENDFLVGLDVIIVCIKNKIYAQK